MPERTRELPRGERIYVVCPSGNRSRRAASWLAAAGLDAWSVAGGTGARVPAGRPVVHGPHGNAA
ncbi:rhodanese-like domain-containing protein [Amycolatopsis cynarae]|uniref:Rhodanese-like domain-containing protein n=1 Tax=Amycolatopsis cynarae TaxID=2995223 RepID=A0ABY7BBT4_9PSEU|nr:rhodanese-like domain-containing protein [Amycolatopsis sp. HUAS 11-8]WAL69404.1 rhodanese-like domain-containing protein [Amycolatopsis sp. HUAS 11-8]